MQVKAFGERGEFVDDVYWDRFLKRVLKEFCGNVLQHYLYCKKAPREKTHNSGGVSQARFRHRETGKARCPEAQPLHDVLICKATTHLQAHHRLEA